MPIDKTITLYYYDDLSETARARAREWYLQDFPDYYWEEYVVSDIKQLTKYLGMEITKLRFDLATRVVKFHATYSQPADLLRNLKTAYGYDCFERDDSLSKFLRFWRDSIDKLHNNLGCDITFTYNTKDGITIDVNDSATVIAADELCIKSLIVKFKMYVLQCLQQEWDYIHSEDYIAENIRANDYTFTISGERLELN